MGNRFRRGWVGRVGTVAFATALVVGSSAGAATLSPHKKAPVLSLQNVTFLGSAGAQVDATWVAQAKGFFAQQGVNATYQVSTALGSDLAASLIAGAAQFEMISTSITAQAAQGGGPVRALEQIESKSLQQLVISKSFATAHNIPAANSTPADAKKQMQALKGTGIHVDAGVATSEGYIDMLSFGHLYGLTIGAAGGDVNLQLVGSSSAESAAINSGKADAILQTPPVTLEGVGVQIPDVVINFNELPPQNSATYYLVTTVPMIQQHRDTVQAVVTAQLEAWHWAKTHKAAAEQIVGTQLGLNGITQPAQQSAVFYTGLNSSTQPYPTKADFATERSIVNGAITPPLTISWSDFVIPSFIVNAAKTLKLKLLTH